MRFTSLRRPVAGVAVAALAVAGVALVATPAGAAPAGTLTLSPASGNAQTVPTFITSGQCISGSEDVIVTAVGGTGLGEILSPENVVGAQTASFLSVSGSGYSIPSGGSWAGFAGQVGKSTLQGTYTVTVECSGGNTFASRVTFLGGSLSGTANTFTSSPVYPTSTALAVSPAGNGSFGPARTYTAAISSISGAPALSGSVQFTDNNVNIGTPVTVVAGSAALVRTPSVGSHSIRAVYTPDAAGGAAGLTPSTSSATAFSITASVPTVALVGPSSSAAGDRATFVATVTNGGVGNVEFSYQKGTAGTPTTTLVPVSAGSATFNWDISPLQATGADYIVKATFRSTDANYADSATQSIDPFAVSAPAGIQNQETIQVEIPTGALSATVAVTSPVTLANFNISNDGRYFYASGNINPVLVGDTRPGDLGWSASAVSTEFVPCVSNVGAGSPFVAGGSTRNANPAAAAPNGLFAPALGTTAQPGCSLTALVALPSGYKQSRINAFNLGIAPIVNAEVGKFLNNGVTVASSAPYQAQVLLPADTTNGTTGLGSSKTLVVGAGGQAAIDTTLGAYNGAVVGSATGTAVVSGLLTLKIPTVTQKGAYAATLTITVI